MTPPTSEEMGMADSVYVDELGDTEIVVFKVGDKESRVSTVVIRGATDNYMDDIERAVDDGVNVFKGTLNTSLKTEEPVPILLLQFKDCVRMAILLQEVELQR